MQVDILIKNATILTMDASFSTIEGGCIAIKDGSIIDVCSGTCSFKTAKEIDASGKLVLPGFVNTHTHAAMTIYRGLADDKALMDWLENYIWPAEVEFGTQESVKLGTELAIIEMLQSGTTTFNDMYFFQDTVAEVAKQIGMRVMIGEGILNFPTPSIKDPSQSFVVIEKMIRRWKDEALVSCAIAPHAPYTCDEDRLIEAKELAQKYELPYHIHLSETLYEVEESIKNEGLSPVAYLDRIGVLDEKTVAAHCVHLSDTDLEIMKRTNTSVSYNPQSNLKLGSGIAPIYKYIEKGIRIGIGTDGVASNNNLNMIKEVNVAANLQKGISNNAAVIPAKDALFMATQGGANILGMGASIGSIEKGKKADVILFDIDQAHLVPMYDPYSHIVYASNGNEVDTVIVNGRVLMENRKLTTIDQDRVLNAVKELSKKIKKKFVQ